jgi:polyhydroxyalkanoate synthesis regulator phasin
MSLQDCVNEEMSETISLLVKNSELARKAISALETRIRILETKISQLNK